MNLVAGTEPTTTRTGLFAEDVAPDSGIALDEAGTEEDGADLVGDGEGLVPRGLVTGSLLLAVVALGSSVARRSRGWSVAAAVVGTAAVAFLVSGAFALKSGVIDALASSQEPTGSAEYDALFTRDALASLVHLRFGVWAVAACLVVATAGSIVDAVTTGRALSSLGTPPAGGAASPWAPPAPAPAPPARPTSPWVPDA